MRNSFPGSNAAGGRIARETNIELVSDAGGTTGATQKLHINMRRKTKMQSVIVASQLHRRSTVMKSFIRLQNYFQ